jgi:hypothetical protein
MLDNSLGWIIHYVPDASGDTDIVNIHTHGVEEKFEHLDLQITVPVNPQVVGEILHGVVNQIAAGKVFKEGDLSDEVLGGGFIVGFKEFTECDRKVLRILFPDKNNVLPDQEGCQPMYVKQLIDIDF